MMEVQKTTYFRSIILLGGALFHPNKDWKKRTCFCGASFLVHHHVIILLYRPDAMLRHWTLSLLYSINDIQTNRGSFSFGTVYVPADWVCHETQE
jgi:hypothetical protein